MSLYPTRGVCVGVCGVSCMLTDIFESSRVFSCGYTSVVNKLYIYIFRWRGGKLWQRDRHHFGVRKK